MPAGTARKRQALKNAALRAWPKTAFLEKKRCSCSGACRYDIIEGPASFGEAAGKERLYGSSMYSERAALAGREWAGS